MPVLFEQAFKKNHSKLDVKQFWQYLRTCQSGLARKWTTAKDLDKIEKQIEEQIYEWRKWLKGKKQQSIGDNGDKATKGAATAASTYNNWANMEIP